MSATNSCSCCAPVAREWHHTNSSSSQKNGGCSYSFQFRNDSRLLILNVEYIVHCTLSLEPALTSGTKTKMGGTDYFGRHCGQFLVGRGIEILTVEKGGVVTRRSASFA
jgi:hypothetical protein